MFKMRIRHISAINRYENLKKKVKNFKRRLIYDLNKSVKGGDFFLSGLFRGNAKYADFFFKIQKLATKKKTFTQKVIFIKKI